MADPPSKMPLTVAALTVFDLALPDRLQRPKTGYKVDPHYQTDTIRIRPSVVDGNGCRWADEAIVVPDISDINAELLNVAHDAPFNGHLEH